MFLVVFRNRKRADIDYPAYAAEAERMLHLAQQRAGFRSFKSYTADDGEVIALSEWADEGSARAWGRDAEHMAVQGRGRSAYYASYTLFTCADPRIHHFEAPPFRSEGRVMDIILYGIPNCDTVKKARAWLDARGIGYSFHDYKKLGADPEQLAAWADRTGWEVLLNRRGTAFRKLPDADKEGLDSAKAVRVMAANPSTIKRPVVEYPGGLLVGFAEAEWAAALGWHVPDNPA
jgi:arsenate reductase (glutaredoxin)